MPAGVKPCLGGGLLRFTFVRGAPVWFPKSSADDFHHFNVVGLKSFIDRAYALASWPDQVTQPVPINCVARNTTATVHKAAAMRILEPLLLFIPSPPSAADNS